MTTKHAPVLLHVALHYAEDALADLAPYCKRIEIAGSVRRRKPQCADAEVLLIPRQTFIDMFGAPAGDDDVTLYLREHTGYSVKAEWQYRLNSRGSRVFGTRNKLMLFHGFPVDVFTTAPENWGMAKVIRTGPVELNVALMRRLLHVGWKGEAYGGIVDTVGVRYDCPTEEHVFELARWPYVEPEQRTPERVLELVKMPWRT